jgi:Cu/Ag efflux pump CusA
MVVGGLVTSTPMTLLGLSVLYSTFMRGRAEVET